MQPKNTKSSYKGTIGSNFHLSKLWNDLIKGFPNQGCFLIWSIRRDMFRRIMPLQICGAITAAWRPTSPTLRPRKEYSLRGYHVINLTILNFKNCLISKASLVFIESSIEETYQWVWIRWPSLWRRYFYPIVFEVKQDRKCCEGHMKYCNQPTTQAKKMILLVVRYMNQT